jgi:hypothetical protein
MRGPLGDGDSPLAVNPKISSPWCAISEALIKKFAAKWRPPTIESAPTYYRHVRKLIPGEVAVSMGDGKLRAIIVLEDGRFCQLDQYGDTWCFTAEGLDEGWCVGGRGGSCMSKKKLEGVIRGWLASLPEQQMSLF